MGPGFHDGHHRFREHFGAGLYSYIPGYGDYGYDDYGYDAWAITPATLHASSIGMFTPPLAGSGGRSGPATDPAAQHHLIGSKGHRNAHRKI
jgi:hypothetical protein